MPKRKQGIAAVTLVAALGLVSPGVLGGSALADMSPHNPNSVISTFDCDRDGNSTYETEYDLISTGSSTMWQDLKSNTVVVQRLQLDVLYSDYTVDHDPTGAAVDFHDATADWWFTPQTYSQGTGAGQGNGNGNGKGQGNGKPQGWKTVRCLETNIYQYAPYPSDVALNDEFGLEFVQNTDDDTTPGSCPDEAPGPREDLSECVTYTETDVVLYDVTLSQAGQRMKSASVENGKSAASAHRAQHGKHRGNGQHRR